MSNKIKMEQSSWGRWYCFVESDNGKGDFSEVEIGYGMDRAELLEKAMRFLGIGIEYIVDGKVIK